MKKFLLALVILLLLFPKYAFAQNFLVSSEVTYEILEAGKVVVEQAISITNSETEVQATDFTLSLVGSRPEGITVSGESGTLPSRVEKDGDITKIRVVFDEAVVGQGAKREFSIKYTDQSLVKNTGEITEVVVPRLVDADTYSSYLVRLKVPQSFGNPAYISPDPDTELSTAGSTTYYFDKTDVNRAGVSAAFGVFQVYSFDLTYHLQNPLAYPTKMEIPLPPDTSYQKVYYNSLTPAPNNIGTDQDDNWIAVYNLGARERVDVRALGHAQIFSSPWKLTPISDSQKEASLLPSEYWQTDDPAIKELASSLHSPKEIYDYVVSTLSYNYDRVAEGTERLGALSVLSDPKNAICTEFTDLFIALARASGIPAREVNGYAYTDNEVLQPLSLVADVLHAWPEYWDIERRVWVPVDPTWEDTTGGTNYFDKLDMRHFAFVMHGANPTEPTPPGSYKLGANPKKDVFVAVANLPEIMKRDLEVEIHQRTTLPFQGVKIVANIKNPGPAALYDQNIELFFENDSKFQRSISTILPYETRTLEFTMPYGIFGTEMPERATLLVGTKKHEYATDKKPAIVRDVALITFFLTITGIGSYLILGRK